MYNSSHFNNSNKERKKEKKQWEGKKHDKNDYINIYLHTNI